jgi:hypothetical protein
LLHNEIAKSFEKKYYFNYIFMQEKLITKSNILGGDMKKLFTILFVLLSISVYSQPVMDGNFDGEAVWGAPKAIADNNTGWASAQAKKFYVTADANYLYLGAEVTASFWMAWAFIINTQPGGATSDSWARRVYYNHPPDSNARPDFTARGHFSSYAEIYKWIGTQWQRDPNSGLDSTEYGENIEGSLADGWVEIRVPQSTLGSPAVGDIQFYITGDYNEHGCFDACPDDSVATSWTDSVTISNYQTNIRFAKTLNLKALIEGFYDGSNMVSDTVSVELRNASSPYDKKDEAIVVLNSAGSGTPNFYKATDATDYYVAIKHRNSLETWSKVPQQFTSGTLTYDFTTAAAQAYGDNLKLKGTKYCMFGGDVPVQDGLIDLTDVIAVINDANAFLTGIALPNDLTGDESVDLSDIIIVVNNSNAFVSKQTPETLLKKHKKNLYQEGAN